MHGIDIIIIISSEKIYKYIAINEGKVLGQREGGRNYSKLKAQNC